MAFVARRWSAGQMTQRRDESGGLVSMTPSSLGASLSVHRFRHDAMGSTFEIFILGEEEKYARGAADKAFEELDLLEGEMSRHIESSDVSRINLLGHRRPVKAGIAVFDCLKTAAEVHARTGGAFDATVGALMTAWQDAGEKELGSEEIAAARTRTGMELLVIDDKEHAVGLKAEGVKIDLGAIGKGYAVDRIALLLRDWSIDRALISAGHSTVLAIGSPAGADGWTVSLRDPQSQTGAAGTILLRDAALSGSGTLIHGRHIIDPRTGRPAGGKLGTWARAATAAVSDALSTAFFVMSDEEIERYVTLHPEIGAMAALPAGPRCTIRRWGKWH